jgi:monofunctional biosynthetic peptidoglycan transglycosylase
MTAVTEEGLTYPRGGFARLAKVMLIALAVLLLVPYLLAPLYRVVDPVSTLMMARWLTGRNVVHVNRPIGTLAPSLVLSVLAAEDDRFCSHHGIDWDAIAVAVHKAGDIEDARGSSTITQQVAKNLFLWGGRSFVRKGLEFPLALWIDLTMPKRRIMEIYLNIAQWGPAGEFGAEAAARSAFGKPAAGLSPHEAALLAAILPNPVKRSARRPGPGVRRLAGIYQARAGRVGASADCLALGLKEQGLKEHWRPSWLSSIRRPS